MLGMTKENICYELRGLFKRQPRVVVEWLLRSDEPRSMFFSQLERENKKKIEKFQYNLIEKLQLTRQQAFKTLKPILEELETIIGIFFLHLKSYFFSFVFRDGPFWEAFKSVQRNNPTKKEVERACWTKISSQKC